MSCFKRVGVALAMAGMIASGFSCGGSSTTDDAGGTPNTPTAADVTVKLVNLEGTKLDLTAQPIPRRVAVELTFSRAMTDTAAVVAGASLVDDAGNAVVGTFAWNTENTVLTWTPSANLRYRTTYHAQITEEALTKSFEKAAGPLDQTFTTMTEGDLNGDGRSDLIASGENYWEGATFNMGMAAVFSGATITAGTVLADALAEFHGLENDYLGRVVAIAGDVNADGYDDILVAAPERTLAPDGMVGVVLLFSGKDLANTTTLANALSTIHGEAGDTNFGEHIAGIGDFNNDGYADFAAQAVVPGGTGVRDAYLFSGKAVAAEMRANEALVRIRGGVGEQFGESLAAAGDVDADGFDDVLVGSPRTKDAATNNVGALRLFSGQSITAATTVDDAQARILGVQDDGGFGNSCAGVGDVNGDGTPDIAGGAQLANSNKGLAYVLDGATIASTTTVAAPLATIQGMVAGDYMGKSLAGLGDVDGDGKGDVGIGENLAGDNNKGAVHVFSGKDLTGLLNKDAALVSIQGKGNNDTMGSAVGGAGDVDGDGRADIVAGARGYSAGAGQGAIYLFSGASLTSATTADDAISRIDGPAPANAEFGMSVGTTFR